MVIISNFHHYKQQNKPTLKKEGGEVCDYLPLLATTFPKSQSNPTNFYLWSRYHTFKSVSNQSILLIDLLYWICLISQTVCISLLSLIIDFDELCYVIHFIKEGMFSYTSPSIMFSEWVANFLCEKFEFRAQPIFPPFNGRRWGVV